MASDELDEKDFIQEGYQKDPSTLWLFLTFFLTIVVLLWLIGNWSQILLDKKKQTDPFLQVTNREFSLFVWQHPNFMRVNQKTTVGYLPDFHTDDDVRVIPYFADQLVSLPDEVLFRYHVWRRLLYNSVVQRPIESGEFEAFLESCREWLPKNWKKAPKNYVELVERLSILTGPLDQKKLPHEVLLAFQGWKNYYFERKQIENLVPSKDFLKVFLERRPHYGRSFFRNLIPSYLLDLVEPKRRIEKDQMTYFLQAALYNESTVTNPSS